MNKYRLIVDSSCDLPISFIEKYNIKIDNLIISFNDRQYADRKDITASEVFALVEKNKVYPKTSTTTIPDLESLFQNELKDYEHIFFLTMSSLLSSLNNNAHIAIKDLGFEEKVTVLDSESISAGIGLLAIAISEDINKNLSVEEIVNNHYERVNKVSLSSTIDSMDFLYRGGRCSGLSYLVGNKLNIHPIVKMEAGKMTVHTLVRGSSIKKGIKKMCEEFMTEFKNDNIDFSYPILIPEVMGKKGAKKIKKILDGVVGKNILMPFESSGITACHSGKNTVGLSYMLKRN